MLGVRASYDITMATYGNQHNEQLYTVRTYILHEIPGVPMSLARFATTQLQRASKDIHGGERIEDIIPIFCDRNIMSEFSENFKSVRFTKVNLV